MSAPDQSRSRGWTALGPVVGLSLVVAFFFAVPPHPGVSWLDVRTVLVHSVQVGVVGVGMTLVIIGGGIDLSVGSAVALAGVVSALAARAEWPAIGVLAAGLSAGAFCGLYNGLLVTALRLPPFIVTLGTLGFYRGLAKWISHSRVIDAAPGWLGDITRPIPADPRWLVAPAVWIMLATALAMAGVLHRTVLGRQVVAIGSNETAARYAGVPIARRRVQMYVLCGVLAGLAGLLQFGRLRSGDPVVAVGLELDAVAAAVIGGASLSGGVGSLWGTVVGAVMMAYLRNRCTALGWENYVQEMIVGHIILIAVGADFLRRRRGS